MSEVRLNNILGKWREKHGHETMRTRGSEMRTIVSVAFADGTAGKISRKDFGSWEIDKAPDTVPTKKTKASQISRTEALLCPELRASLGSSQ